MFPSRYLLFLWTLSYKENSYFRVEDVLFKFMYLVSIASSSEKLHIDNQNLASYFIGDFYIILVESHI